MTVRQISESDVKDVQPCGSCRTESTKLDLRKYCNSVFGEIQAIYRHTVVIYVGCYGGVYLPQKFQKVLHTNTEIKWQSILILFHLVLVYE